MKTKTCCEGKKKKCFKCQLTELAVSHEARRAVLSADLMNALELDERAEEEKRYAQDMGVDY